MMNFEQTWVGRLRQRVRQTVSPQAGAIAFVGAVCLILMGHEALRILELRSEAIEDGRKDTANLARSIAQHAEDTVRTVDAVLVGMVERLETDGAKAEDGERLRRLFQDRVGMLPQLKGLSILDENGISIVNSLAVTQRIGFADRDYFLHHQANRGHQVFIGKPVRSKAVGDWVIPVSRRIDHADGSFAGVALATVDADYFQRFYHTFEIGEKGAVLLALTDGTLLVRRPFAESNIGKSLSAGVIFHDHLPKSPIGSAEMKSSTDGVTRLNSYRRLESYPLVVAVAEATDEILAQWWTHVRSELLRGAGVVAGIALLGMLLSRRTRALSTQSALLQATLDNMNQGLMVVDETGRLPVCNRRAMQLLDLPAALMASRPRVADVLAYQADHGEFVGMPAGIRNQLEPQSVEDVYVRKRPNGLILEIQSMPFAKGGLVRTFTDITASTLSALELKERERLLRLLADNTTDVVARLGPDLRYAYVSPASRDVLGREPEELIGQHAGDIVHPADRGHWTKPLVSAEGEAGEVMQAIFRALRPNGSCVWVEENRRRLPAGEGFVVSIRDISRRKEAEALLEDANRRLEVLARQDGLTELANRRHFDEALDVEFRRAKRDGTVLSLIMIDVDRFKRFNDIYGHPAGDACLRNISATVKKALLRPGDLVARYGGEELAVMLPNTQDAGARAIAERIRQAVRALRIPHEANPDRIVTISLGVAWLPPNSDAEGPEDLVKMADGALYASKASGRDRVCSTGDLADRKIAAARG